MRTIDTYKEIGITSEVLGASAQQQIKLILEKLNQDISSASNAIKNNDLILKCKKLANAHDIIVYLKDCLDFEADKEMASRLNGIYNHLIHILFWANAKNDINKLNEAKTIAENITTWWNNVTHTG